MDVKTNEFLMSIKVPVDRVGTNGEAVKNILEHWLLIKDHSDRDVLSETCNNKLIFDELNIILLEFNLFF